MDLKQNAFLRQWISPHQHRKYKHFFTINALLEYYFFNYKEIATFSQAVKRRRTISRPPTNVHSQNSFFNLITVEIPTLSILAIFLTG